MEGQIPLPIIKPGMEIGKVYLDTNEISINTHALIKYTCSVSGDCCRRFTIPITDFDIKKIEDQGFELDQIVENLSPSLVMPKTEFGSIEKNYRIKRKPFLKECTFLKDGVCSIHEFKPFGCRIFPFQLYILDENTVSVRIHESNFCPSVHSSDNNSQENGKYLKFIKTTIQDELTYRKKYLADLKSRSIVI